jgi:hypothetical protein
MVSETNNEGITTDETDMQKLLGSDMNNYIAINEKLRINGKIPRQIQCSMNHK